RSVTLESGPRRAECVALVGGLMDRNEEDHRANLDELRRAFTALSLDLVSVWPDGGSLEGLAAAGTAGTVVSLPYGRQAATLLAERTGARLVELDIPLGFEASRQWMLALGEAFDRRRQAEDFCDRELRRVMPRLEWAVSHLFLNRRVMLVAEPSLLAGLAGLVVELGATVAAAVAVGKFRTEGQEASLRGLAARVLARPTSGTFRIEWERARAEGLDLLVAPSDALREAGRKGRCVEFGFPSHFWHALAPQPFLLFEGALALVQRLSEGLQERP
ncbi:MAG: nitrogenase component 1, partial [Elusimicrobiota bacterium]